MRSLLLNLGMPPTDNGSCFPLPCPRTHSLLHAANQTRMVRGAYGSSRVFNNMCVGCADLGGGTVAEWIPMRSESVPVKGKAGDGVGNW
jgi:hypothetical protein